MEFVQKIRIEYRLTLKKQKETGTKNELGQSDMDHYVISPPLLIFLLHISVKCTSPTLNQHFPMIFGWKIRNMSQNCDWRLV